MKLIFFNSSTKYFYIHFPKQKKKEFMNLVLKNTLLNYIKQMIILVNCLVTTITTTSIVPAIIILASTTTIIVTDTTTTTNTTIGIDIVPS